MVSIYIEVVSKCFYIFDILVMFYSIKGCLPLREMGCVNRIATKLIGTQQGFYKFRWYTSHQLHF